MRPFTRPERRRTLRARRQADSFTESAHSRSVHSPFGSFLRLLVRLSARIYDTARRSLAASSTTRQDARSPVRSTDCPPDSPRLAHGRRASEPRIASVAITCSLCERNLTETGNFASQSKPSGFPSMLGSTRDDTPCRIRARAPTHSPQHRQNGCRPLAALASWRRLAPLGRPHCSVSVLDDACFVVPWNSAPSQARHELPLLGFADLLLPRARLRARVKNYIASNTRAIATQISKSCATPLVMSPCERLSRDVGGRVLRTYGPSNRLALGSPRGNCWGFERGHSSAPNDECPGCHNCRRSSRRPSWLRGGSASKRRRKR